MQGLLEQGLMSDKRAQLPRNPRSGDRLRRIVEVGAIAACQDDHGSLALLSVARILQFVNTLLREGLTWLCNSGAREVERPVVPFPSPHMIANTSHPQLFDAFLLKSSTLPNNVRTAGRFLAGCY